MERTETTKGPTLGKQTPLKHVFFLLLVGSCIGQCFSQEDAKETREPFSYTFNFTVGEKNEVGLTFHKVSNMLVTINFADYIGEIELKSADPKIFKSEVKILFEITENTTFPFHEHIELRGEYVGRSVLEAHPANVDPSRVAPMNSVIVNVHTPFRKLGDVATVILAVWLGVSYVIMAAKVEPSVLLTKIKPPWGIIVGMVCQFVLMPPLAFSMARVFGLTGATAIGLVMVGTCPGGFFSNIEILLLDCDVVLSLAMTTVSTLLAVAMMPLNLFIYTQPFVSQNRLKTPFRSLMIQLAALVLPLVIAVPFFYRFPKARKFCNKLVKPFTFVLMILGVVLFIPPQYYIFFSDWKSWVTSAALPLIGAFLGMSITRIANFKYKFSITVAIETGCQNTLLAVSIAKLYYPSPESDVVAIIPLLIAMVTGFEGIIIATVYMIGRFLYKNMKRDKASLESHGNSFRQTEFTVNREDQRPNSVIIGATDRETTFLHHNIPTFRNVNPTVVYDEERIANMMTVSSIVAHADREANDPTEHHQGSLNDGEPFSRTGSLNAGYLSEQS